MRRCIYSQVQSHPHHPHPPPAGPKTERSPRIPPSSSLHLHPRIVVDYERRGRPSAFPSISFSPTLTESLLSILPFPVITWNKRFSSSLSLCNGRGPPPPFAGELQQLSFPAFLSFLRATGCGLLYPHGLRGRLGYWSPAGGRWQQRRRRGSALFPGAALRHLPEILGRMQERPPAALRGGDRVAQRRPPRGPRHLWPLQWISRPARRDGARCAPQSPQCEVILPHSLSGDWGCFFLDFLWCIFSCPWWEHLE